MTTNLDRLYIKDKEVPGVIYDSQGSNGWNWTEASPGLPGPGLPLTLIEILGIGEHGSLENYIGALKEGERKQALQSGMEKVGAAAAKAGSPETRILDAAQQLVAGA
jgi:hypothetical protein